MDIRHQHGLVIAATAKIIKKGSAWIVPSLSGKGRYTVRPHDKTLRCTCPDNETNGGKCKHIIAVEHVVRREQTDSDPTPAIAVEVPRRTSPSKTVIRAGAVATFAV